MRKGRRYAPTKLIRGDYMTDLHIAYDDLTTPEGKRLFLHFREEIKDLRHEILNLQHRIAFANKAAACNLLRPHEMNRIDEIMGTK